eukprot:SAG11_NODE_527_length_8731_cov_3.883457_4_plen_112_part_00
MARGSLRGAAYAEDAMCAEGAAVCSQTRFESPSGTKLHPAATGGTRIACAVAPPQVGSVKIGGFRVAPSKALCAVRVAFLFSLARPKMGMGLILCAAVFETRMLRQSARVK